MIRATVEATAAWGDWQFAITAVIIAIVFVALVDYFILRPRH